MVLTHSDKIFQQTFQQSPIGIALLDLDFHFIKVNQELCRIAGYHKEEMTRLSLADITEENDADHSLLFGNDLISKRIDQFQREERLLCKDKTKNWIRQSVRLVRDDHGEPQYFISMIEDINERKRKEEEKEIQLELLHFISREGSLSQLMEALLPFFKARFGIDAIAIRLKNGNDFPYYKTCGFPIEFVRRENNLIAVDNAGQTGLKLNEQPHLECMCGCVIAGQNDPSSPFFTATGSFFTNSTSQLLMQAENLQMPSSLRGHCNEAGYESVLLIPLKVADTTLGLLQLNHKDVEFFSADFITLMERLADHLSLAVVQRLADERLQAKQLELQEMNTTLKVLIRNREEELQEHDRELLTNVRQLVLPWIDRLKLGALDSQQQAQLNILEGNLLTVTAPFAKKMSCANLALTPALIQVADMIRKGISNKEIAKLLGISVKSVETYRKRIRARLDLQNSKINLRTYLMNMD